MRATFVNDQPKILWLFWSRWLGRLQVLALDSPRQDDCGVRRHAIHTAHILTDLVSLGPASLVARLQVSGYLEVRLLLCDLVLQVQIH